MLSPRRRPAGGPPPPPEPGPLLYGKLPARADFVRRGAASPALDAFDDLVQRAIRSGPRAKSGPLYRMVYAPPGPHALVGAVRLSRDKVGRAYPLVAGRTVARDRLDPATAASWPLRWGPLFDASAWLVEAALRGAPLDDLDDRLAHLPDLDPVDGRSAEVDTHVRALAHLRAHSLWQRTWGGSGASGAAVVFHRLAKAPPAPPPYGLRFPLPPAAPDFRSRDAVAVWLAVCWYLLSTRGTGLTLLWAEGPPYALFVFFTGPSPATVRALLGGASDPDRVAHVDRGAAEAARRAAADLPQAFRRLLRDPDASVADVLARLHTIR